MQHRKATRRHQKGMIDIPMGLMLQFISLIVLIMVIFSSVKYVQNFIKPTERVAFANAELLRIAIDDVCAGKGSTTVDFDFPQPEPFTAWGVLPTLVPGFMLRSQGDPHYLLYYESFPAGEASGWEAFLEVKNRVVMPMPSDIKDNPSAIKSRIDAVSAVLNVSSDNIIFSNIVLGNTTIGDYKLVGDSGSWDAEGTFYKVPGYLTLPNANQTAIKYRSCGANALCLKTRDGVYKLDLPHCGNLSYIGLEDEYGGITGIWERTDFYFASPCKAKLKIESGTCECNDMEAGTPFALLYANEQESQITYDIYKYDDTAQKVGTRTNCLHRLAGNQDSMGGKDINNCIIVSVIDWDGFCITQDKKINLVAAGAILAGGAITGAEIYLSIGRIIGFFKGIVGAVKSAFSTGAAVTLTKTEAYADDFGATMVGGPMPAGGTAPTPSPTLSGIALKLAIQLLRPVLGKVAVELERLVAAGGVGLLLEGYYWATEPSPVRDQATFTTAFNSVKIDVSQFSPRVFGPRASARAMWLWP